MTDAPRPPDQAADRPDDGGRDAEIAAALEVPALDETTRRRLVRTAADAADEPPAGASTRSVSRLGAAIGVAAVLLVGAVVGAVVVTRPDDPQTPTAARAPSTSPTTGAAGAAPAPQSAEDAPPEEQDAATVSGGPPEQLGDLGTAEGETGLRQALDSAFREGRGRAFRPPRPKPSPAATATRPSSDWRRSPRRASPSSTAGPSPCWSGPRPKARTWPW